MTRKLKAMPLGLHFPFSNSNATRTWVSRVQDGEEGVFSMTWRVAFKTFNLNMMKLCSRNKPPLGRTPMMPGCHGMGQPPIASETPNL